MNTLQAKKIPLYDLLARLGYSPQDTRKYGNEIWYNSPFRSETKPSFKIKLDQNVWYDFGEGIGGNVLDFVMKFNRCGLKEALTFLGGSSIKPSVYNPVVNETQAELKFFDIESPLIQSIKPVFHYGLKNYLKERCIPLEIAFLHLKEISYKVDEKSYFGLGFPNKSGGWEIRNPLFKGCLGKKDISVIETGEKRISVFEGFFDYLSCLAFSDEENLKSDILILNSTGMKGRAVEFLKEKGYTELDTYLDNDGAGNSTLNFFTKELPNILITDKQHLYQPFKDFNEYLITISSKPEAQSQN